MTFEEFITGEVIKLVEQSQKEHNMSSVATLASMTSIFIHMAKRIDEKSLADLIVAMLNEDEAGCKAALLMLQGKHVEYLLKNETDSVTIH